MAPAAISNADMLALREYVTADGASGQNRAENTVLIAVSHSNLKANFMELRLDLHMSVEGVKRKLMSHTGTNPSAMVLQLKSPDGQLIAQLEDRHKLGYYSPTDGCLIHVIDTDPTSMSANGWLDDVSKVQKYEMSDAEYSKRENTYRAFKQMKLAEDPEWTAEKELAARRGAPYAPPAARKTFDEDHDAAAAARLSVGQRCQVQPGDRRGVVKWVGKLAPLPAGFWVGVHLDEPVGRNDGSVKGERAFECPPQYGMFARPINVAAGDFPALDEGLESSDFGTDDEL